MEHHFEEALKGFREWIRLLNYSASNVYYSPRKTEEFLIYAMQQGKRNLQALDQELTHHFFAHLAARKNQRRPGGLSLNSLWNYRYAINLFARYLRETGQAHFVVEEILKHRGIIPKDILTPAEIKSLYEATEENPLGLRDRAMLAVFYGCGVRKNEGLHLEVKDILPERNMLYVRKGKGYKERYVPLTRQVKADLENYLHHGRPELLKYKADTRRLFIAVTGKPMTSGMALYDRMQALKAQAGITRPVGLHTLRHSIATHLLQSGMKLEQIAKFLGHSTLESTQIYTHITQL